MSDTLISSVETTTDTQKTDAPKTGDVSTDTAPTTGDSKDAMLDKMYDHPSGQKNEQGDAEGDTKDIQSEDTAEQPDTEGEDKPKEGEEEKEKSEDKVEPIDFSDVEFDLPEGMELNQEILGELSTLAGELKLSKDNAAKIVPLGVKLIESAFAKQQTEYQNTRNEWRDTVAQDKEIGGADEATRKQKLAIASKGLDAIGSPELRTLLNETGLGDNPAFIRAFYRAGLQASEDVVEQGGSGRTVNPLDAMYPTMAVQKK